MNSLVSEQRRIENYHSIHVNELTNTIKYINQWIQSIEFLRISFFGSLLFLLYCHSWLKFLSISPTSYSVAHLFPVSISTLTGIESRIRIRSIADRVVREKKWIEKKRKERNVFVSFFFSSTSTFPTLRSSHSFAKCNYTCKNRFDPVAWYYVCETLILPRLCYVDVEMKRFLFGVSHLSLWLNECVCLCFFSSSFCIEKGHTITITIPIIVITTSTIELKYISSCLVSLFHC